MAQLKVLILASTSVPFRPTTVLIGKFVILRYDKILFTEHAKPVARKSSKNFK